MASCIKQSTSLWFTKISFWEYNMIISMATMNFWETGTISWRQVKKLWSMNIQLSVPILYNSISHILWSHYVFYGSWTIFTFPGFSAAEVVIVGLTWRAVNGRVSQVYFLHSHFVQIANKDSMIVFSWLSIKEKRRERLITAVRRANDVKFTIPPIDAVLETPSY